MKYAAYPEYQEFDSESLDKCPKGWKDVAVKHCFDIQLGKMLQTKPESIEDVEMQYFKAQHVNWDRVTVENLPLMWASPNDLKKYSVNNGDLLVSEGGDVGRASILNNLEGEAIIQNALHRVRNYALGEIRFFAYVLRHLKSIGWFDILCNKATIAHLTGEKLSAIKIPLPTKIEQEKIAAFLDYKTQQIDQLIEKKKALIEKLNEQRIAVITQAVTRGLDKNAKMKPSGVEWLGDVPAHWEVKRLRFCIISNPLKSGIKKLEDEDLVSFVPMEAVKEYGGMDLRQTRMLDEVYKGYTYFKENDVVVAKITPCFENGKGSIATGLKNGVGFGTTEFHVLRNLESMDEEYLFYLSISYPFRKNGEAIMIGAGGHKRISEDYVKDYRQGIPEKEEQRDIVKYIKTRLIQIDKMIGINKEIVERYEEYRSALITDVVTGKIDVRDVEWIKEVS